MERLTVACWKWQPQPGYYGAPFAPSTVNTLRAMVARHYRQPHDFVCLTDDPVGLEPGIRIVKLWDDHATLPGPHGVSCYRRLRAFSIEAAEIIGSRFVSVDLDCVITGDLAPLWDRPEDFVIWGDTAKDTPYNGSMWLLRAGSRRKVWDSFHPVDSPALGRSLGYIGSDQAWIGAALGTGEAKWRQADGVYSWRLDVKKAGGSLPADARIVFFHGREKPWHPEIQAKHAWVAEHYR